MTKINMDEAVILLLDMNFRNPFAQKFKYTQIHFSDYMRLLFETDFYLIVRGGFVQKKAFFTRSSGLSVYDGSNTIPVLNSSFKYIIDILKRATEYKMELQISYPNDSLVGIRRIRLELNKTSEIFQCRELIDINGQETNVTDSILIKKNIRFIVNKFDLGYEDVKQVLKEFGFNDQNFLY